jgi:hypothetical protein
LGRGERRRSEAGRGREARGRVNTGAVWHAGVHVRHCPPGRARVCRACVGEGEPKGEPIKGRSFQEVRSGHSPFACANVPAALDFAHEVAHDRCADIALRSGLRSRGGSESDEQEEKRSRHWKSCPMGKTISFKPNSKRDFVNSLTQIWFPCLFWRGLGQGTTPTTNQRPWGCTEKPT